MGNRADREQRKEKERGGERERDRHSGPSSARATPSYVDYLEHRLRERFLRAEEVSRNFPAEVRLHWVCPILSRSVRVQPLRDSPPTRRRKKRQQRRGGDLAVAVFHLYSRSESLRDLSFPGRVRCPSLIRHSYIRTIAKRSTTSRKTSIRNRPRKRTHRERARPLFSLSLSCSSLSLPFLSSVPRDSLSVPRRLCLSHPESHAGCLSSFDPPPLRQSREKVRGIVPLRNR